MADDRGRLPHFGDDDGGTLMPITEGAPDDIRGSLAAAGALTGDADLSPCGTPEEAFWMLGHPALAPLVRPTSTQRPPVACRSAALRDMGYYVSRSAAGDHLVIDGGRHGYQNGGHAHSDALSLTFTIGGLPLLIDPGTGCYTANPRLRDRFRSTALHNTLTLDGRPQSEPLGPFHWARVTDGRVRCWRTNEAFDFFEGSHDGYAPVEHRRFVLTLHGDLLIVADLVNGPGAHVAAVHWHIDPRWTVDMAARHATFSAGARRVGLSVPGGVFDLFRGDDASGLGWHSPIYGQVEPSTTIRATEERGAPFWMLSVFDLDPGNVVRSVERLPVQFEAGTAGGAAALEISRALSVDYVLIRSGGAGGSVSAESPLTHQRVGIAGLETDARMLFVRTIANCSPTRLALVDGSMAAASNGLPLVLPRVVPHLCVDVVHGRAVTRICRS
jgi:hypothetical protein